MNKYRIIETEKHLSCFYVVEADNTEEAKRLYIEELAGSLEESEPPIYNPDIDGWDLQVQLLNTESHE